MKLLRFLKRVAKSRTVWGAVIAASGPTLIPAILSVAPVVLDAAGVSPDAAGKIVGLAGAALAVYGRIRARGPLTG